MTVTVTATFQLCTDDKGTVLIGVWCATEHDALLAVKAGTAMMERCHRLDLPAPAAAPAAAAAAAEGGGGAVEPDMTKVTMTATETPTATEAKPQAGANTASSEKAAHASSVTKRPHLDDGVGVGGGANTNAGAGVAGPPGGGISLAVGVCSGQVFCGEIGSPDRWKSLVVLLVVLLVV